MQSTGRERRAPLITRLLVDEVPHNVSPRRSHSQELAEGELANAVAIGLRKWTKGQLGGEPCQIVRCIRDVLEQCLERKKVRALRLYYGR